MSCTHQPGHQRSHEVTVRSNHAGDQPASYTSRGTMGHTGSQSGVVRLGVIHQKSHSPANIPRVTTHGRSLPGHIEDVTQVSELSLVREELTVTLKVLQHRRVVCVDGLEEGEREGVRR